MLFRSFTFLNFIFYKAVLGVACLRCRQYVRNSAAALTTYTLNLDKIADLVKLTWKTTHTYSFLRIKLWKFEKKL